MQVGANAQSASVGKIPRARTWTVGPGALRLPCVRSPGTREPAGPGAHTGDAAAARVQVGIRLARRDDAPALAWIRTASWRAAYRDIIPARALERIAAHDAGRMSRAVTQRRPGHALWLACDPDDTALGYVWLAPQTDRRLPFLGEVIELYLHPQWQRRGIGRQLLVHAIWSAIAMGLQPVMLWALADNRAARGFYEGLGGVAVEQRPIELGGRVLQTVAYGWHALLPLPSLADVRGPLAPP